LCPRAYKVVETVYDILFGFALGNEVDHLRFGEYGTDATYIDN
jgi:hypothetical protein